MIHIPSCTPYIQAASSVPSSVERFVPEEGIGGRSGCTALFFSCVSALQKEPIMQRSPKGKKVIELLIYIEQSFQDHVTDIAVFLVTKLNGCIANGKKHRFPSASHGCVWSAFHVLRNSTEIKERWCTFMRMAKIPEPLQIECQFALQLVMDRILKKMLTNKVNVLEHPEAVAMTQLTMQERSAIRYMAGYVAIKLLKRYSKPSAHPQLQRKHSLFVRVLKGMRATHQPDAVTTLSDYTCLWMELIDLGGLYHISDEASVNCA